MIYLVNPFLISYILQPALSEKLLVSLFITNDIYRGVIISTFLIPCTISAFTSGWLCDRFGSKIVSLTSVIISIPAFIWIGVPNQSIQSIVSALVVGGITVSGTTVSIILVTTKVLQKIIRSGSRKDNIKHHQLASTTIIFTIIGSTSGIGYFAGSFLSRLNSLIGFFWLCFILAMLLATCIPFMAYYSKSHISKRNIGLSQSTSKKSIINNTRPVSFAESMLSDDTTIRSSSIESVCDNIVMERKSSIIVIP